MKMSDYYPVFVSLRDRLVILVGGGPVARRKARMLLRHGARIRVIAPNVDEELLRLADEGAIEVLQREYVDGNLEGAFLVFIATDDPTVNEAAYRECRRRGILVNTVDEPRLSDFISASILARGDLQIAVSTSGACPRLARRIREHLDDEFGPEYKTYLEVLGEARTEVIHSNLTESEKRDLIDALLDSNILDLILGGKVDEARAEVKRILRDSRQ